MRTLCTVATVTRVVNGLTHSQFSRPVSQAAGRSWVGVAGRHSSAGSYSTTMSAVAPAAPSTETGSRFIVDHPNNNVPPHIAELVGRDLHLTENHPIYIIRQKIQDYFAGLDDDFTIFNGEGGGGGAVVVQ